MASILQVIKDTKSNVENVDEKGMYVITISLPINKVTNVNFYAVDDNIGKAYLANNTTERDALDGFTRFSLTGVGRNCIILSLASFKESWILQMENYLNNRFGNNWSASLVLLK